MKIERDKEWWLARARREGDAAVGAGLLALDPRPEEHSTTADSPAVALTAAPAPVGEARIAFGRFVSFMRRRRGMTVEKLADESAVDIGELVSIEDDLQFIPEPRAVYQLAKTFGVPQQSLMQLAGLVVANDVGFRREVVRFAARSEPTQKLTAEENAALEALIAVLSSRWDGNKVR